MLADQCQICHSPLMQKRDSAPQCVVCNPVGQKPKPTIQSKTIIKNKSKPIAKINTCNAVQLNGIDELNQMNDDKLWNDASFDRRMKKADNASAKIGELLLKGWTMLADHCSKCQTPLMSLKGGTPKCCMCDTQSTNNVAQKQEDTNYNKVQQQNKLNVIMEEKKEQNVDDKTLNIPSQPPKSTGMNGFDDYAEYRRNDTDEYDGYGPTHYGYYNRRPRPSPMFGFGQRQDEQLRHTLDDIVKTVLDKMSVINERMKKNEGNLQNDIAELNSLMGFLRNVNDFKSRCRR